MTQLKVAVLSILCSIVGFCYGCTSEVPAPDAGASIAGSPDSGIENTVGGRQFEVVDSIWNDQLSDGFDFNGPAKYVEMSGYQDSCAVWNGQAERADGQNFVVGLAATDQSGNSTAAFQTGDYNIVDNGTMPVSTKVAEAVYLGQCDFQGTYIGISGTVHVQSISNLMVSGTYDVILRCGDSTCSSTDRVHLVGGFDAANCSAFNVDRSPTCASDGGA